MPLIELVGEVALCAVVALAFPISYTRREDRRRKEAHRS